MALPPDYDEDPSRWRAWRPSQDVHDWLGPEVRGPVLDVGCGDGRLRAALRSEVEWFGVDLSWTQLSGASGHRAVLADMRVLPFPDGVFEEVTHLWCLYHVDDPVAAISEARRVLRPGGRYYACTSARANDPELVRDGYPTTSFDAEDAPEIVGRVFPSVVEHRWDEPLYELATREDVLAYCRSHLIPLERVDQVEVPLRLTKRGVLLRASG